MPLVHGTVVCVPTKVHSPTLSCSGFLWLALALQTRQGLHRYRHESQCEQSPADFRSKMSRVAPALRKLSGHAQSAKAAYACMLVLSASLLEPSGSRATTPARCSLHVCPGRRTYRYFRSHLILPGLGMRPCQGSARHCQRPRGSLMIGPHKTPAGFERGTGSRRMS